MILVTIWYDMQNIILYSMFVTTTPVYLYIIKKSLLRYIFLWKIFLDSRSSFIFPYGNHLHKNSKGILVKILKSIHWDFESIEKMIQNTPKADLIGLPIYLLIFWTLYKSQEIEYLVGGNLFDVYLFPQLCIFFLLYIVVYALHSLIDNLHPLYAFWNLWSKIQSLTPLVEEKSREIQKSFQEDMNFSVLSDGFDALASTFSEIISLVIKLEKIEAKANRGNIFDSEKYIKSLRSDILDPLKQLKSFLEKQREELMKSQKELERVRVGGADLSLRSRWQTTIGWQEQKELASKRSESLLIELTENIEKLDTMIQEIA